MDENLLFKADTEVDKFPVQLTWLHVCLAVSCDNDQISLVVNGVKVLDMPFEKTTCPTSLVGNLALMKTFSAGGFCIQSVGRVTNVNVFSGLMSQDLMVSRTSGEDCGKQDGDLLSWKDSSWSLRGNATKWIDVSVEDLCLEFSRIQLFTMSGVTEPDDCKRLCRRVQENSRMTSVETTSHFTKLKDRLRAIPNTNHIIIWLPITKKNNTWVDSYTETRISMTEWSPGYPAEEPGQVCSIYATMAPGYNNMECSTDTGWYCSCDFPEHPFLKMRGLCKDSLLDKTYLPQNSPLIGETTYYGNLQTVARYLRDENQWKMETIFYNTTAVSKEISGRFMLGKQNWTIEGDSKNCHDGKPYTAVLKLTGCKEGEFTCDDGQCVLMEERCNQVPDCRDDSDERDCKVIILKDGYNKNIPPIKSVYDGRVIPAHVSISINLMKVVEIEETDHSIQLQFEISMQWRENRVKYQNLKKKSSLNVLTKADIGQLWLPLVIYENTDQKESTRLGENWEWMTRVTVSREGNFSRTGINKVDEAEIFEGAENKLTMNQTYTRKFQCKYELKPYPFDTQVHL